MKMILAFVFIILTAGCTLQSPRPLSELDKKEITDAVTQAAHKSVDACNQVNFPHFKDLFIESPDYIAISSDGSIMNYAQHMKGENDFFESVSSLNLSILDESVKVLEGSLAVYTVHLKVNATLKSGGKLTFDKLVISEIYKKIDKQWKISFFQESGLPPTTN